MDTSVSPSCASQEVLRSGRRGGRASCHVGRRARGHRGCRGRPLRGAPQNAPLMELTVARRRWTQQGRGAHPALPLSLLGPQRPSLRFASSHQEPRSGRGSEGPKCAWGPTPPRARTAGARREPKPLALLLS